MRNLFKNNSEKIHRILMVIKLSIGTLAGSAYAMDNDKLGFWLLAATGLMDVIVSIFSKDESKNNNQNDKQN